MSQCGFPVNPILIHGVKKEEQRASVQVWVIMPEQPKRRHSVNEKLTLFRPIFNRSIRIKAGPERLTTDPGAAPRGSNVYF